MSTRYLLRKLPTQNELQDSSVAWKNYWEHIELPKARFNIGPHPFRTAPLVTRKGYEEMLFGMKPLWADSILVNAKSEGIKQSKFWKPLVAMRPCLIPADGFYVVKEAALANDKSTQEKTWYGVEFENHQAFFIAGLWKPIKDNPNDLKQRTMRFVLLTRESHSCVKTLNDRMPVIFSPAEIIEAQTWMNTQLDLDTRMATLLHSTVYSNLVSFPVSKRIKNLGNDDSALFTEA